MLQLVDVAFGYDGFADLFTNVEFSLEMGSRICLCGTGWAHCGTRARQCSAAASAAGLRRAFLSATFAAQGRTASASRRC